MGVQQNLHRNPNLFWMPIGHLCMDARGCPSKWSGPLALKSHYDRVPILQFVSSREPYVQK